MRWFRFPRIVGIVVIAYLILVTGYFAFEAARRSRFIADAKSTPGTVVALEPRPLAGTTRVHTLGDDVPRAPEVRYVVDGKTYLYTPTHGLIGSPVQVGDQIEVLYDANNPARARLRNEGQLLLPLITAGFATTAIGVVVLLVLTRRRGRPARHGGDTPASTAGASLEPEPATT